MKNKYKAKQVRNILIIIALIIFCIAGVSYYLINKDNQIKNDVEVNQEIDQEDVDICLDNMEQDEVCLILNNIKDYTDLDFGIVKEVKFGWNFELDNGDINKLMEGKEMVIETKVDEKTIGSLDDFFTENDFIVDEYNTGTAIGKSILGYKKDGMYCKVYSEVETAHSNILSISCSLLSEEIKGELINLITFLTESGACHIDNLEYCIRDGLIEMLQDLGFTSMSDVALKIGATEIVKNNMPASITFWTEANCPNTTGMFEYSQSLPGYVITSCITDGDLGTHGGCFYCIMSKITLEKEDSIVINSEKAVPSEIDITGNSALLKIPNDPTFKGVSKYNLMCGKKPNNYTVFNKSIDVEGDISSPLFDQTVLLDNLEYDTTYYCMVELCKTIPSYYEWCSWMKDFGFTTESE